MSEHPSRQCLAISAEDLPEYLRGLNEIEAKWVATEERIAAELRGLPRWRFWRRSMLRAELSGINSGLLNLSMERIDVQFRVRSTG